MELGAGQRSSAGNGMPGLAVGIGKKRLYRASSPKVYTGKPILKPKAPEKIELDQSPIETTLKEILPLTFVQVRSSTHFPGKTL